MAAPYIKMIVTYRVTGTIDVSVDDRLCCGKDATIEAEDKALENTDMNDLEIEGYEIVSEK